MRKARWGERAGGLRREDEAMRAGHKTSPSSRIQDVSGHPCDRGVAPPAGMPVSDGPGRRFSVNVLLGKLPILYLKIAS